MVKKYLMKALLQFRQRLEARGRVLWTVKSFEMNTQIYEEACAWFVDAARRLDDAGRREFDRWLRKSPEHLSSYLEIAAIWNEGRSSTQGQVVH